MSDVTRRGFLQTGAAAGLLLTGTRASGQINGANERLRIAVIGLNGRGQSHIDGWSSQENVEIACVVDPDSRALARGLERVRGKGHEQCQGLTDVRRMLEDQSIDAISIATPNHWHSLLTIWGAQAGKHVYVEKPMSHDVAEGRVAVEAQKKYGVVIQHGTQTRSSAGVAGLHEAIQAGKFGRLKIAYGYCCKPRGSIGMEATGSPQRIWTGISGAAPR